MSRVLSIQPHHTAVNIDFTEEILSLYDWTDLNTICDHQKGIKLGNIYSFYFHLVWKFSP